MKIVLFDEINETAVSAALAKALKQLGCDVTVTGRIFAGHEFPHGNDKIRMISEVDRLIESGADAVFNFRPSSLRPNSVRRLREAGIQTIVWLSDDPVLYRRIYSNVVDLYDHVLHCGNDKALAFYDSRGHRPGLNFPFWYDIDAFQYRYDPAVAIFDAVFLGNIAGPTKRGRYKLLAPLKDYLTVYGRINDDPLGIGSGYIDGIDTLSAILSRFRVGVSIPQFFSDYAGTKHEFAELSSLGHFDLPSRVLQYAAIGLPVLNLGVSSSSRHFPDTLSSRTPEEARTVLLQARENPELLRRISRAAREAFERFFTGQARARLLLALCRGELDVGSLSVDAREFAYRWFAYDSDGWGFEPAANDPNAAPT